MQPDQAEQSVRLPPIDTTGLRWPEQSATLCFDSIVGLILFDGARIVV